MTFKGRNIKIIDMIPKQQMISFSLFVWFFYFTPLISCAYADPIDNWHAVNSSSQTNAINACVYGTDKFVAVGNYGTILTSSDGSAWTSKSVGSSQTLRAVAYGKGKFVAVGDYGTVLSSTDGSTWTTISSSSLQNLRAITFGNGKFVTVGDYGTILTSQDGSTWTTIDPGSFQTLRAVTYGNNKFVAVGDYGGISTSSDGATWQSKNAGSSQTLRAITFGNGKFIAAGDFGAILTSSEGATWTTESSGVPDSLYGIAFGNNAYVSVGNYGTILTSSDGNTWTSITPVISYALYCVSFGGDRFIAAGNYGTIVQSEKTSSPSPNIIVSPAGLNFGNVAVGATAAAKIVTVSNKGNADLSVQSIALSGLNSSEFTKLNDLCSSKSFGPSEKCTFGITFTPTEKGLRNASISISSDDPDQPAVNIPIKGAVKIITVPNIFSIKGSAGKGGSIIPSGNVTVQKGADQTFTITTNDGYELVDVKVDGVSQGAVSTYTFNSVSVNHKITAAFNIKTYQITVSAGLNGRVVPSGTVQVNHGKSKTYFIKPAKGYKIADVLVDGASVGAVSKYSFTEVKEDHTIEASFEATSK